MLYKCLDKTCAIVKPCRMIISPGEGGGGIRVRFNLLRSKFLIHTCGQKH